MTKLSGESCLSARSHSDNQQLNDVPSSQNNLIAKKHPAEHPAERASRLRIKEADARWQRRKDAALFGSFVIISFALVSVGIWAIVSDMASSEVVGWAFTTLTLFATAASRYLFGKSSVKRSGED